MTTMIPAELPLPYTGRTYTIEDGRWAGGPALRSFLQIMNDWGIGSGEGARVLGVDEDTFAGWASDALAGQFPGLPDEVLASLSHVLVLRRELTNLLGPEGRAQAEWLRRPYDDALFRPQGRSWHSPERPIEATPIETMLGGGVRWVREIFHPREPLAAYASPDYEMLANGHHDWLPAKSTRAIASAQALRAYSRVMEMWGFGVAAQTRLAGVQSGFGSMVLLANADGWVERDDAELARMTHAIAVRRALYEVMGPDANQWRSQRAWFREPHPELLGHERTPAGLVADVMASDRPLGDIRHPMLTIRRALDAQAGRPPAEDTPDYDLIDEADELPAWMRSH